MNDFNIELAKLYYESTEDYPVNFDDAWQWLGYSRKDNAKKVLVKNFQRNLDYSAELRNQPNTSASGFTQVEILMLTNDCFRSLGMLAQTEKGKEIRKYYLQVEKAYKANQAPKLPPVSLQDVHNLMGDVKYLENSGDHQFAQLIKNFVGNKVHQELGNALAPAEEKYEGVIDYAIRLGFIVPSNYESALGRFIGKIFPELRLKKGKRYSNASSKLVQPWLYPANNPKIESAISDYCDSHIQKGTKGFGIVN